MEKFQELREAAKKKIHVADHMLTQTYPSIKDPKLLLAIIENIFLALTSAMGALLYYERAFKRIPPFQDNFSSQFNVFRARCADKYKISNDYVELIQDIRELMLKHKKSPVEFTRKDSFVICSEDYRMVAVSIGKIKDYIHKTKLFIQEVSTITIKNEGIFDS